MPFVGATQPRTLTNCVSALGTGGHVKLAPLNTIGGVQMVRKVRILSGYGVQDRVPALENSSPEHFLCGFRILFAVFVSLFFRMRRPPLQQARNNVWFNTLLHAFDVRTMTIYHGYPT